MDREAATRFYAWYDDLLLSISLVGGRIKTSLRNYNHVLP